MVKSKSKCLLHEMANPFATQNTITMSSHSRIRANSFYSEYHGHKISHLNILLPALRESTDALIWTAGDSSLDNKYWFNDTAPAVEGTVYQTILDPPRMKMDVTYWLNRLLKDAEEERKNRPVSHNSCNNSGSRSRQPRLAAINAAVEATTLNERTFRLRPQDIFIRDNIRSEDILIVSVGGNDVALMPLPCTIASLGGILCLPSFCLEQGFSYGACHLDDCCLGCGASLASCACACPPCLGYVKHLFGTRVEKYIQALTAKTKPHKILVCMIYYPDEANSPSWSGPALGALGYNSNPTKVQTLIRKGFHEATSSIRIRGSQVIPVPLFHALDGKNTSDYIQRVEPSPNGGRKLAELLINAIEQVNSTFIKDGNMPMMPAAPSTLLMKDRS